MKKTGLLEIKIPSQGSSQFLTARTEMLDGYDRARVKSKGHIVQTSHGNFAEAAFRKWLENFLPKKYGITSGYIISQGESEETKAPHFDVIIYDQLESPVLWIDDNSDYSDQGKSLAIPAENVRGVFEIKSAFYKSSVVSSIKHLKELNNLMSGIDDVNEKYKLYLPPSFFCGLIFFELRESDSKNFNALTEMINCLDLRGYIGGLILRGENHPEELTAMIKMGKSESKPEEKTNLDEKGLLQRIAISSDWHEVNGSYLTPFIDWRQSNFSQFAFDLVAILNQSFEPGRLSSFHGYSLP